MALARDLPRLWHAPTTQSKDRKRVFRLPIKGDISVQLPPNIADRVGYPSAVVDRIRELARDLPDGEIADQLHREGQVSAKGRPYTVKIQWIRCRYWIPPADLKKPQGLTVQQVAQRYGTSDQVVYLLDRAQGDPIASN